MCDDAKVLHDSLVCTQFGHIILSFPFFSMIVVDIKLPQRVKAMESD